MSDESVRAISQHSKWEIVKKSHYDGLSDEDRRMNIEGILLDTLSKYGGKRIVAGKVMHELVQDLTKVIFTMKDDGLL